MSERQLNLEQSDRWQYLDAFPRSPVLTSYETDWNSIGLHHQTSQQLQPIRSFDGLSPLQLKPVINYIKDNLDQDLGLEELAAIAQLSQYYFSRAFKRSMGISPHQYIIRQRVDRAKLLLREKKMSICEVAIVCGFTHQSHLNRDFKRLTGVTPKVFQKS